MNSESSSAANSSSQTSIASLETPTSSNSKRSKFSDHHVHFSIDDSTKNNNSDQHIIEDEDTLHAEIDAMSRSTSSAQLEEMDPHEHVESILANITEEPSLAKQTNIDTVFKPKGLKPSTSNMSLCSVAAAVPMKFKQEDMDDNVHEYTAHAAVNKALDFRQLGPQDFEKLKLLGKGGLVLLLNFLLEVLKFL